LTYENIYYLLHLIYTCEYVYIYPRVSSIHSGLGIRGFGFGDGFPPELVFGSGSGFDFGFWFLVHGDFTRSKPDPLTSLPVNHGRRLEEAMGGDGPCPSRLPLSLGKQGDEISWMSEMVF
jgi:hypothetical protein